MIDDLRIIEDFVKEHDGEYKKNQLLNKLDSISYPNYCLCLRVLEHFNRISFDSKGKIGYIPPICKEDLNELKRPSFDK